MSKLSTAEIAQELNHAFAEEVEAATRYLHLRNAVRGLDRLIVSDVLKQEFQATIEHAEIIAVSCPAEPVSGREALQQALMLEEAALEGYQDLLKKVEGDVPLEEFARAQIAAESEHVAQIRELLDE